MAAALKRLRDPHTQIPRSKDILLFRVDIGPQGEGGHRINSREDAAKMVLTQEDCAILINP